MSILTSRPKVFRIEDYLKEMLAYFLLFSIILIVPPQQIQGGQMVYILYFKRH
jgi:hypothetical protein